MPALGYYLGAAFASVLLVYGLVLCWRRRETAILAGLARRRRSPTPPPALGGTPYTAAKAIEVARAASAAAAHPPAAAAPTPVGAGLLPSLAAAGVCSLLAFANAPVGPTSYSPALTGLRPLVAAGSTLVLASPQLLDDEHGDRYIAWELRGGRVCIEAERRSRTATAAARASASSSPKASAAQPPFPGLRLRRVAPPYVLWEATGPSRGQSPCPLIAVRQARQGPAR